MKPVVTIAHGARFSPNTRNIVRANACAPPECSNNDPKIAPNPMIVAMNPKLDAIPLSIIGPMSANDNRPLPPVNSALDPIATTKLEMISAKNACIFHFRISHNNTATAKTSSPIKYGNESVPTPAAEIKGIKRIGNSTITPPFLAHSTTRCNPGVVLPHLAAMVPIVIARLCLIPLALATSCLSAEELVKAKNGSGIFGYKHTPKLPWCDYLVHDPDRPAPPIVTPAPSQTPTPPPADAIILFDGTDLSHWDPGSWKLTDGTLEAHGNKSPRTKQEFGSFQLHLEWMAPANFQGPWHDQGNNGVLIHGLYEIQIFDSHNIKLYPDGQCAAVYAQTPPLVNATLPPGQWQTYQIIFTAPVFKDDELVSPARITMFHNGILVHHHQEIFGATGHMVLPHYNRKISNGPLVLHGHNCPVRFRNIWIRKL
jgi:hypothetical protein